MGMLNAVMQKANTISASMEFCLRTKRMPCFRLLNIDSVVVSGRNRAEMMESEMTGARKESAFSPKHHFSPNFASAMPGERRTNGYRQVELNRIQRDGVGHVLALDQRRNQRLVRRSAKGLGQAGDERETEDRPHMDQSGRHQHGEQRRARHLHVLGDEENLAPLDPVGHHPADQREEKDGNAAEKLIEREQKGRMAQPVDQPALRHNLHPGANAGRTGTEPHQAEIAILKCFKYPAKC